MADKNQSHVIDVGFDGKPVQKTFLITGMTHRITFKTPMLLLDHRYHDDTPVSGAEYEIELEDGQVLRGHLDDEGKAEIRDMGSRPLRVRYGLDSRPYEIVDDGTNPSYIAQFSKAESDAMATPGVKKAIHPPDATAFGLEAVEWIWGTVKGGFNEKQTVSQIIVDAVIGMIPLVGDVTAVRDLIAIVLGLAQDPKKRGSKLEWLALVVLLFALIPVIGGAIKGVGKLLLRGSKEAAVASKHIREIVAFLNRLGMGDALKWVKELNLESHTGELLGKWRELTHRLEMVLDSIQSRMKSVLPKPMLEHLAQIKVKIMEVAQKGEEMIPDAVKDLHERLKAAQRQLYNGDWHDIPKNLTSETREVEARLVDVPGGKKWTVENMHFPPNGRESFFKREDWPDLASGKYVKVDAATDKITYKIIPCFHGPMRAIRIPGGTRIYRIIEGNERIFGPWWVYSLPESGKEWREQLAVLKSFSRDGNYVELIVPPEGLCIWEGKASSQVQNDLHFPNSEGQYMPGGQTQIFLDFGFGAEKIGLTNEEFVKRIEIKVEKTPWTDDYNSDDFNVPKKETEANFLGPFDMESKSRLPATLIEKGSRRRRNDDT